MNLSVSELVMLRCALAQRGDRLNHMADDLLESSGFTPERNLSIANARASLRREAAEYAELMRKVHREIVSRDEAEMGGEVAP